MWPDASVASTDIESIHAIGDVHAARISGAGSIECDDLQLGLTRDTTGRTIPALMTARRRVHAVTGRETIWTQQLHATFRPAAADEGAGQATGGSVEIDRLSAAGGVQVLLADGSRAFGENLEGDSAAGTIDLIGGDVIVVQERMIIDGGRHLALRRGDNAARWDGPGQARSFRDPVPIDHAGRDPIDPASLAAGVPVELQLSWRGGVDLALAPTDDAAGESALRSATFSDHVLVLSDDLAFNADRMTAEFCTPPDGATDIRSIFASGGVELDQFADQSSMRCREMQLELARAADGRIVPLEMIGRGDVEAADPQQTLWAGMVQVLFEGATGAPAGPVDSAAPAGVGLSAAESRVRTAVAEGAVQVLFADGRRAFCDRLVVHPGEESVDLSGTHVVIVADGTIFERGTQVTYNRRTGEARADGPGEARTYAMSIQPPAAGRLERPPIVNEDLPGNPLQLRVRWSEAMTYDGAASAGAGAIEFRGSVEALARPSEFELDTMSGDALSLEFAPAGESPAPARSTPAPGAIGGERRVSRLTARGGAKLENRVWRQADHADRPRVFYLAGDSVRYDSTAMEAEVLGAGTLLVRDEAVPQPLPAAQPAGAAASQPLFGARGTTLFRWTERLHMVSALDDLFAVTITGNVEVTHGGAGDREGTISCARLQAMIERRGTSAVDASPQVLDLGGAATLRRFSAFETVFIRTPNYDVDCGEFTYDPLRGIGRIAGHQGGTRRPATILPRGTPNPVHARGAEWDMTTDVIRITGPRR
jgi:lipopolysaccharide export system protein LptA